MPSITRSLACHPSSSLRRTSRYSRRRCCHRAVARRHYRASGALPHRSRPLLRSTVPLMGTVEPRNSMPAADLSPRALVRHSTFNRIACGTLAAAASACDRPFRWLPRSGDLAMPPANSPKAPRILRKPEVLSKLNVSGTTLWRMRRRGDFPPGFRISPGTMGWREADVDTWIEDRGRAPQTRPSTRQASSLHQDTVLNHLKGRKSR